MSLAAAMGFSSLGAYAIERCQLRQRWVEESCTVAGRLGELPLLERSLEQGLLSWSKVDLAGRVADACPRRSALRTGRSTSATGTAA